MHTLEYILKYYQWLVYTVTKDNTKYDFNDMKSFYLFQVLPIPDTKVKKAIPYKSFRPVSRAILAKVYQLQDDVFTTKQLYPLIKQYDLNYNYFLKNKNKAVRDRLAYLCSLGIILKIKNGVWKRNFSTMLLESGNVVMPKIMARVTHRDHENKINRKCFYDASLK